MLKCIVCKTEYPEEINFTNDRCHANPLVTTLYRTVLPEFDFPKSPLDPYKDNIFLKREDKNPNGCFKDRKSKFITFNKYNLTTKYALASCGNQALSFAKTNPKSVDCTKLYLPTDVSYEKLREIKKYYKDINFVDRILSTKELTQSNGGYNITNGMDPIGASAIYSLGYELEPYNFDTIVVPMGSGELYSMLSVYFKILRNKSINIIPVKCHHPLAEAIKTDFVPMTPFIKYFDVEPVIASNIESITNHAEQFGCCHSSAVVFDVPKDLIKGKTCMIVTGAK